MASNANTDVDKLITFGQMALEQGWYDQAREYFEQALVLDASNREAMKGLARVNEVLSRKAAIEPIRREVLVAKPVHSARPKVEPAKPQRTGEPTTKQAGKKRWLALAVVIPLLLLVLSVAYQRFQPTPTPQVDYARVYETQVAQREATRAAEATPTPQVDYARVYETQVAQRETTRTAEAAFNAISFTDPLLAVEVEILQILTGYSVVRYGKIYSYERENALEQGKDVVYFEVRVKNQGFNGELNVSYVRFKLESTKGETFSAESSNDRIGAGIHKGRSTRGGMTFDIYRDAVPKLLRYDTGLRDTWSGEELEAISPDLEEYFQ